MDKELKEKIRPIYSQLQGFLSQAPTIKELPFVTDPSFWTQYNQAIEELNQISGVNYDRFLINPKQTPRGIQKIEMTEYRSKLGGLISRLHAEYFSDELAPFSGMPSTVITQSQQQAQSVQIEILLEIQSEIDRKLPNYKDGTKEKTFLERLKASLNSVANITQLIGLILRIAKEVGLSINQIYSIFS